MVPEVIENKGVELTGGGAKDYGRQRGEVNSRQLKVKDQ
jgi:hypothetical protein